MYLLMKSRASFAYLYHYATVIETSGAISIVKIDAEIYHANYQLGRLQSGMEAASGQIFYSLDTAREEMERLLPDYK